MAQFPVSKPFPPNASAADFVQRIRDIGWAPCTAEQLFGYAQVQFSRILPTGKAKSAVALRRAKAQAVDAWFEAMGLPESLVTEQDFTDSADGNRWVAGLGLDCSENDTLGTIAIGAFDLRSDGTFEMTTVDRHALVERWDSRLGGPIAQRLLFNTAPLEVVVAVFTDDGSLLVAGFHPRVFRLNARTLGEASELTAIRNTATCPHGPPDSDDAEEDEDYELDAEPRAVQLRGTPRGTLALNCCDDWALLSNDGRGASQFLSIEGKVCFPPDETFTNTEWCIADRGQGRTTVYHLPDGDVWATLTVTGGALISAVMPDHRTIVTLSEGGYLQWWTLPASKSSTTAPTLSAHMDIPAGATFLALLPAMEGAPPFLLVHTRYRRLALLDPFSGAMRGETSRSKGVDRALRAGANHVVLWDTPEDPSGFQLNPLQCVWAEGIGLSESAEGAGILPDGRMVRAAFGVIVEDPRTGELLADYRPD